MVPNGPRALPSTPHFRAAQVKAGSALAHLGRAAEAVAAFALVLDEPLDGCTDLYLEAGTTLLGLGQAQHALPFFE